MYTCTAECYYPDFSLLRSLAPLPPHLANTDVRPLAFPRTLIQDILSQKFVFIRFRKFSKNVMIDGVKNEISKSNNSVHPTTYVLHSKTVKCVRIVFRNCPRTPRWTNLIPSGKNLKVDKQTIKGTGTAFILVNYNTLYVTQYILFVTSFLQIFGSFIYVVEDLLQYIYLFIMYLLH